MYPSRWGFYSKFFIYKQTGLSQLFIVLLALILTFMSLLLTYHSLVYTSVPACALELGPREPWPGALALSRGSRRHSVSGRWGRRAITSHPSHLVATRRRADHCPQSLALQPQHPGQAAGYGGEAERKSKVGQEERAEGIPFEGLFLPRCQLHRLAELPRSSTGGLGDGSGAMLLQSCLSPAPFHCPAQASAGCVRNEGRAVCCVLFRLWFFFFFFPPPADKLTARHALFW